MQGTRFITDAARRRYEQCHVGRAYAPVGEAGNRVPVANVVGAALGRGGGLSVNQVVVSVDAAQGQGLSWAAEEALEAVVRAHPPWKKVVALGGGDAAGALVALAGWKPVYRALGAGGVRAPGARALRCAAALLGMGALAALSAFGWHVAGSDAPLSAGSWIALASAAVCAGLWWLASSIVRAGMSKGLAARLRDAGLPDAAALAVGEVAGPHLLGGAEDFQVIVVDGYGRLPAAVRESILAALRRGNQTHGVTWFVFDTHESGALRRDLAGIRHGTGAGAAVMAYDLQPLAPEERKRIAEANGVPAAQARNDAELFGALAARRTDAAAPTGGSA